MREVAGTYRSRRSSIELVSLEIVTAGAVEKKTHRRSGLASGYGGQTGLPTRTGMLQNKVIKSLKNANSVQFIRHTTQTEHFALGSFSMLVIWDTATPPFRTGAARKGPFLTSSPHLSFKRRLEVRGLGK